MKCSNCGYEIDKPNLKTCPLCGYKIVRKVQVETPLPEIAEPKIGTLPSDQTVVANVDQSSSIQKDEPKMTPQEPVSPLTVECPGCHLRIPVDSNFCPHCGYDMHSPQEDNNKPEETSEPQEEPIQQPEPEIEPEPVYINEEEPEEQTPTSTPENYRVEEDVDEYIENGSYQPYPDEEEDKKDDDIDDDNTQDKTSSNSWIIITVVAILSVAIGAILYNIVY